MNEIIPPIAPTPVVVTGMSWASKIILGVVIIVIVGAVITLYVIKKPNEETRKEIVSKSVSGQDAPIGMTPIDFTKDFSCTTTTTKPSFMMGSVDGVFTHPYFFQSDVKQVFVGEDIYIQNQAKNESKGEPVKYCDWLKTKKTASDVGPGWTSPEYMISGVLPGEYRRGAIKCEQKPIPRSEVEISGVICGVEGNMEWLQYTEINGRWYVKQP